MASTATSEGASQVIAPLRDQDHVGFAKILGETNVALLGDGLLSRLANQYENRLGPQPYYWRDSRLKKSWMIRVAEMS